MNERTPGEWRVTQTPGLETCYVEDRTGQAIARVGRLVDGRAICLAVNSHEALVSALRGMLELEFSEIATAHEADKIVDAARAALKKAEGGE